MFEKIIYYSGINYLYKKLFQRPHIICVGYHSVRPEALAEVPYSHLVVNTRDFENQLEYLKNSGYKFISIKDLKSLKRIDDKYILVYFDDGFKDVVDYALPILKKYEIRGTVFVVTDYTSGKSNPWNEKNTFMTWGDIRENLNNLDFQSHTVSHRKLSRLDEEDIMKELTLPREVIMKETGEEVFAISYPHSSFNKRIQELAIEQDYDITIGNGRGLNFDLGKHLKKIPTSKMSNINDFKVRTGILYLLNNTIKRK